RPEGWKGGEESEVERLDDPRAIIPPPFPITRAKRDGQVAVLAKKRLSVNKEERAKGRRLISRDRRVARGGCPPRAPTDPYVRDYRIRLLGLGTRCETIDRLHHTGGWKRIPLKHRAKPIPSHPCAVRAPVQPLPPNAPDLISVPLQGR